MVDESLSPRAEPPYLLAALICDDTLEEKDGRLSVLRLTSEVKVEVEGLKPPAKMPPIPIRVTVLMSFNAGGKPGSYEVQLNVIDPGGTERPGPIIPMDLPHDHFTMNLIARIQLQAKEVGLYWVAVLLNGREVTRTPLTVQYVSKATEQQKHGSSEEEDSPRATH